MIEKPKIKEGVRKFFVLMMTFAMLCSVSAVAFANSGGSGGDQGGVSPSGGGSGHPHSGGKVTYVWFDDGPRDGKTTFPTQGYYTRDGKWHNATNGKGTNEFFIDLLTQKVRNSYGSNLTFAKNTSVYVPSPWATYNNVLKEACEDALARDSRAKYARIVAVGCTFRYGKSGDYKGKWYFGARSVGNKDTALADIIKYKIPSTMRTLDSNGVDTKTWSSTPGRDTSNPKSLLAAANGKTPYSQLLYNQGVAKYNKKGGSSMNWAIYALAVTDLEPVDDTSVSFVKTSRIPSMTNGNNCYDNVDATFEVYDNTGKKLHTLKTKKVGDKYKTDEIKLKEGTYKVVETISPKGFWRVLQPNVVYEHTIRISSDGIQQVISDEPDDIDDNDDDESDIVLLEVWENTLCIYTKSGLYSDFPTIAKYSYAYYDENGAMIGNGNTVPASTLQDAIYKQPLTVPAGAKQLRVYYGDAVVNATNADSLELLYDYSF